jgi:hypothetical protein
MLVVVRDLQDFLRILPKYFNAASKVVVFPDASVANSIMNMDTVRK